MNFRFIFMILTVTVVAGRISPSCDEIAIIGGGVAGTYAAWRLRHLNKRITIYEFSDRIGGRHLTHRFPSAPDINAEIGAMRYLPDEHPLFHKTLQELGLPIREFTQGEGESPSTLVYIRGEHFRYRNLGGKNTPYNLNTDERKHPSQLKPELFSNGTNINGLTGDDRKYFVVTRDNVQLYQQSVEAFYHKTASTEAQRFLIESAAFPNSLDGVASATLGYLASLPMNDTNMEVLTVATGFSSISKKLLAEFQSSSRSHRIRFNRHLSSITKQRSGEYILAFDRTQTKEGQTIILKGKHRLGRCAEKVILAINRLSLERLDWDGLKTPRIRELVTKSVRDFPAAKMFLSYPYSWWKQSSVYDVFSVSDTALKQTYDFGRSSRGLSSVLLASYTEATVPFWKELAGRALPGSSSDGNVLYPVSDKMLNIAHRYLSQLYKIPIERIPKPTDGVMGFWDSYPYGGGWQLFNPGYIWSKVEEAMVRPSANDDVFVVSNAFNARAMSTWTEAALQSVELALPHFGIKAINMTYPDRIHCMT